jgi:hypothetical protein
MGLKQETRSIGKYKYRVTQLPALKARALFVRLTKALGPVLGTALEGIGPVTLRGMLGLNGATLGLLINEASTRLTEEDLTYFCDVLGESSELLGESGRGERLTESVQNIHFGGQLLQMFKWMGFALEVNFSDFLDGLKSLKAEKSTGRESSASPSPTDSTGTSGESLPLSA